MWGELVLMWGELVGAHKTHLNKLISEYAENHDEN